MGQIPRSIERISSIQLSIQSTYLS